jgi:hypothetical protein
MLLCEQVNEEDYEINKGLIIRERKGLVLTSAIWLKTLFLDVCVVLPDNPFFPRATGTNQYV